MTRRVKCLLRTVSAALCAGSVGVGVPVLAESSRVVSVEEHWELQVAEPDLGRSAPQTTMVMSPTNDLSGKHFLFTLNHWSAPDYAPGGMEIQVWDGDAISAQTASVALKGCFIIATPLIVGPPKVRVRSREHGVNHVRSLNCRMLGRCCPPAASNCGSRLASRSARRIQPIIRRLGAASPATAPAT